MNILLIGGAGSLINNLIIKLNKEGHKVYLLTGSRFSKGDYQKVFERYNFPYDCACLNEIFESISMDVTIFMGAYDTNFSWEHEEQDAVSFSSGMMNILMSFTMRNKGKFIYISSHDVYSLGQDTNIRERDRVTPVGVKAMVVSQAEEMCDGYRKSKDLDIITIRLGNCISMARSRNELNGIFGKMCMEAIDKNKVTFNANGSLSMIYETDAVEAIYNILSAKEHILNTYNISSGVEVKESFLAEIIQNNFDTSVNVSEEELEKKRVVLWKQSYDDEFPPLSCCELDRILKNQIEYIIKKKKDFLSADRKKNIFQRILDKAGWFGKAMIPFIENVIVFIPAFMLNNRTVGNSYFNRLDFYLLYVLLFAIVYGQQQAIFSSCLAVIGYCFRQMYTRSSFELMLDINTYIWIAQLFILGLVVGYMRDQIGKLKRESKEEIDYLSLQLKDIRDINNSNVRVKGALEKQLVNQNDSLGKIFRITSSLDKYSADEVLFHAAEVLSELVESNDVAIYTIAENGYARLFSATSAKARTLKRSVKVESLGEMYETISAGEVYVNKKLDEHYPVMANMIFDNDDKPKIMLLIWELPWESMTLGQANMLKVVSELIKSAVLRANRYISALQEKRYIEGTGILEPDAFKVICDAYGNAERNGLAESVVLTVKPDPDDSLETVASKIEQNIRESDIYGITDDGEIRILLANTTDEDSKFVAERFANIGYGIEIVEDDVVCLRPDRM